MRQLDRVSAEAQARKEDAGLICGVASALFDPECAAETRWLLREQVTRRPANGLKALLEAAPLHGLDLERSCDTGRALDL